MLARKPGERASDGTSSMSPYSLNFLDCPPSTVRSADCITSTPGKGAITISRLCYNNNAILTNGMFWCIT